ncbi:hypothetical protein F5Y08DRAFT_287553 [Xylaria arbuscula]|nr:hypothetical protein F5Y08DRAFT_287553 [Xylaria arbuscula]
MAPQYQPRPLSSASSEAQLLYHTTEKANLARHKKNRPGVILVALIVLFLSSAGGISLAIVLMAKVQEIEMACFARDFILFAGILSQLYIGLHVFAARREYKREGVGPPQMYGQYLHASAMLVARLAIVTWIAALVATAIMIARSIPLAGFAGKVPFLDLLLCVGAIPSFLIISVTIEKKEKPFATASISNPSFLTCRVSEFADDLSANSSVSRRSSLQQRQSQAGSGSVLTLPTAELLGLGARQQEEEKRLSLFTEKTHHAPPPKVDIVTPQSKLETSNTVPVQAVPEPTYCPGGWRAEWNSVAHDAGVSRSTDSSSNGSSPSSGSDSSTTPLVPASSRLPTSSSSPKPPQLPPAAAPAQQQHHPHPQPPPRTASSTTSSTTTTTTPTNATTTTTPTTTTTNKTLPQQNRYSYTSRATTARLSGTPSNLSTVRYASEPEIAVQQSIRVVRNPAYRPRAGSADFFTATGGSHHSTSTHTTPTATPTPNIPTTIPTPAPTTTNKTQNQNQSQSQSQEREKEMEKEMVQRPDIALLRNAQQAQAQTQIQTQQQQRIETRIRAGTEVKRKEVGSAVPKRTPSNFSRPMPPPIVKTGDEAQGQGQEKQVSTAATKVDKADKVDSEAVVKIPGAFVEDECT